MFHKETFSHLCQIKIKENVKGKRNEEGIEEGKKWKIRKEEN